MKYPIILLCIGFLTGCSLLQQTVDISPPRVLVQHSLPTGPPSANLSRSLIDIMLYVNEDGSVSDVELLEKSEDASWDSMVCASLQQWKFLPARRNNLPISTWLHLHATLRYANPEFVSLAKIICKTKDEADSVYSEIEEGRDFSELATEHSIDSTYKKNIVLGRVDINSYPENIRIILKRLDVNEVTKPVKYGDQFVLFKRLKE